MNHTQLYVGILMVSALLSSMIVLQMDLAPTSAYAHSRDIKGSSHNTTHKHPSKFSHDRQQDIKTNREHRNQHIDQQNFCVKGDVCKNSNVGLETLGNDNSVTGFADQSKNAQEPAATPTATPTPESNDASAATGNSDTAIG